VLCLSPCLPSLLSQLCTLFHIYVHYVTIILCHIKLQIYNHLTDNVKDLNVIKEELIAGLFLQWYFLYSGKDHGPSINTEVEGYSLLIQYVIHIRFRYKHTWNYGPTVVLTFINLRG
jgi:hypothetical protein